jgi:hypothetical protein
MLIWPLKDTVRGYLLVPERRTSQDKDDYVLEYPDYPRIFP